MVIHQNTKRIVEVAFNASDIDDNINMDNIRNYLPKEAMDFYNKNKDKPNFKETYIPGRPRSGNPMDVFSGMVVIMELE